MTDFEENNFMLKKCLFYSIIIATILGVFLGIIAAVKRNTFYDKLSLVLSVLGMAAPSFFIGLIMSDPIYPTGLVHSELKSAARLHASVQSKQ